MPSEPTNAEAGPSTWRTTRAGKRILELREVDESIAQLLHLAGCTIASLHPDPLSSFTSRVVSFEDEEDEEPKEQEEEDKQKQFSQYSEAYYSTLHDIQVSLRTSIRHLRLSRASPAPLLDPFFGSLATPGGGGVAVGGVGMGESLASGELGEGVGEDSGVGAGTREEGKREGREERKEEKKGASVAALGLEMEAWKELGRALSAGEEGVNEET